MADYYFYTFIALALSLLWARSLFGRKYWPDGAKLLPGPKPRPFVGNARDIPSSFLEVKFKEWADRYGAIFRLSIFGKPLVVLSTNKVANDLLKEKGSIYSSRPQVVSMGELLGDDRFIAVQPLDPAKPELSLRWRKYRKVFNTLMNPSAVKQYSKTHELESANFVLDLINNPKLYETWCDRYSAGIVFRLVYGKPVETGKEDYVQEMVSLLHIFEEGSAPGKYLVDTFPILKHLPAVIAPFKRELLKGRVRFFALWGRLENSVKEDMASGAAPPSLTKESLRGHVGQELSSFDSRCVLGQIYGAAVGTTKVALLSLLLSMVHHPSWVKRMQDELDANVGKHRLPTFDDMSSIPIVRAVVKEGLRWRPVSPLGLSHMVIKDDVYNGNLIPAGSLVLANIWAIHRDPELYPDGDTFNPDRWLLPSFPTYQEPLTKFPNLQNFSVFGFGRRICPGQHLAERSLTLAIARIAWACNIAKEIGPDGKEIPVPSHDYTGSLISQPKPFSFSLTARDEHRLKVVKKTVEYWKVNDPLLTDLS